MSLDPIWALTAQIFLGLLLGATSLHKALNPSRAKQALSTYRMVPAWLESPAVWVSVMIEASAASALLIPATSRARGLAATAIFAFYFIIMSANLLRGQRVDCGCSLNARQAALSGSHLIRNAVLVGLALIAAAPDSGRTLGVLDLLQSAAAVICLALVYLSVDTLLAHGGQHARQEV